MSVVVFGGFMKIVQVDYLSYGSAGTNTCFLASACHQEC